MSGLKILHVDTGLTWRGGQRQVLFLHRGLLARGVPSRLLCSAGGELEARAKEAGLQVEGLPMRGEWEFPSALRIASEVRHFNATHLHLHSAHAQTLGLLGARLSGMRCVISTRRVDFAIRRHLANRWKYGRGIARFVAISRAVKEVLLRFGVDEGRIRLVPSGVERIAPPPGAGEAFRRELGLGTGEALVGNVAHLADHKGQRYLIEAIPSVLRECPSARFVIVGEGELEGELKTLAASLGLGDRLIFTGFRTDVPAVLDALDLFVMSSHLEGLGTIVLDAMAAGKPVVATRAGGIPEMIDDGRHGLLVPARDPAALAGAIVRALGEPALAAFLAGEGKKRVLAHYTADAMVEGNLAVYRDLAA